LTNKVNIDLSIEHALRRVGICGIKQL
jgi:hypothetical protein